MYFPSRGGVRGGADQFDWENIKTDKFRENYLGHSLKAPVGRWQKGKDLVWYAKNDDNDKVRKESLAALKRTEEEAMLTALGHAPSKRTNGGAKVSQEELREILKRGQIERDSLDIERVQGMGYYGARAQAAPKQGVAFMTVKRNEHVGKDGVHVSKKIKSDDAVGDDYDDDNQSRQESGNRNRQFDKLTRKKCDSSPSASNSGNSDVDDATAKKYARPSKREKSAFTTKKKKQRHDRDRQKKSGSKVSKKRHDSDSESDSGKLRSRDELESADQDPAGGKRRHSKTAFQDDKSTERHRPKKSDSRRRKHLRGNSDESIRRRRHDSDTD